MENLKHDSPRGSIVALVTPMTDDGALDREAWRGLLDLHAEAGTDAVVIAGTTGESATLTVEERDWLLEAALERLGEARRVIAGTGGAGTDATIRQSRRAAAIGAGAVLVVTPYYNRPPQRGLAAHFRAVADACEVPVILYNVPSRTSTDLKPETTASLADHGNIVAIKEAVADMQRVRDLASTGLVVLSGDDPSACEAMRNGARGVISVAANVVPARFKALCDAALEGDAERAREIDESLRPLYAFLAAESNPIPVKWLLAEAGRIGPALRLPLVGLDEEHHAAGRELLDRLARGT